MCRRDARTIAHVVITITNTPADPNEKERTLAFSNRSIDNKENKQRK